MANVLIVGGAGYIGSRLCSELLNREHSVRILDAFLFGEADAWSTAFPTVDVRVGDVRDRVAVESALVGVQAVIHLAAFSNDPSAEIDERLTIAVNLEAVQRLFDAAARSGVTRFVNASSATVYGIKEQPGEVDEHASLEPLSLYGRLKAESEAYLLSRSSDACSVVSVRAATVHGPSYRQRLDLTVNLLTAHARCLGRITVFGGSQLRPNVHIDDLARAYALLLEADASVVGGEAFNVGRENLSVLDIAERVSGALEAPVPIEVTASNDHRSYRISSRKLESLGFRFDRTIADGARGVLRRLDELGVTDPSNPWFNNVARLRDLGLGTGAIRTSMTDR